MSTRPFATALATLLTVALVAPAAFLATPPRAHALFSTVMEIGANLFTNLKTTVESTITAIEQTIATVSNVTGDLASVAQQINTYVLQPLAFVLSGNLLKMITAGVIAFVIGKANGTGVPQFVVDVQRSLQTVGDSRALAFFDQYGRNSNSPFAASITSSLRNSYLQKTSLAGFWAANMNTLARFSPDVNAYLAGNWSQGGVAAWFALTTQVQNDPYSLYQHSQEQLTVLIGPGVGGATGARLAELGWGQGFASWCGATEGSTTASNDGTEMEVETGVNPGDPCYDKDSNPGTIKTPGSVIAASLNKALGSQTDSILRMGNVGPEINKILGNIATVMQTVNFATQILGGSDSGGLFGVNSTSGANSTSRLSQFQTSPGYLGVTNTDVYKSAAALPSSGADMLNRVGPYESAWNTIGAVANTASTDVTALAAFCTAAAKDAEDNPDSLSGRTPAFVSASKAQAAAATAVLTGKIEPVLAKAAAAVQQVAAARAMVQKVQSELNAATAATTNNYAADIQTLQTMSPTMTEVANVQQDAQAFNIAQASPEGSLTVSGSSLVDQMGLISTNAKALKASVCTPMPPSVGDGGGAI